jgi:hypothetical protein
MLSAHQKVPLNESASPSNLARASRLEPLCAFLLVEVGGARYRLPLSEFRPQGVQVLIHKFECVWSQQQMRWGSRRLDKGDDSTSGLCGISWLFAALGNSGGTNRLEHLVVIRNGSRRSDHRATGPIGPKLSWPWQSGSMRILRLFTVSGGWRQHIVKGRRLHSNGSEGSLILT